MVKKELRGNCTVVTVAHRLNTVVFYDEAPPHSSKGPSLWRHIPPRGHDPGASQARRQTHNLSRARLPMQVLLLERGAVREQGAPLELLSRADGAFRSLAEESGAYPGSSRPHARRPPRRLKAARPSEEFGRGEVILRRCRVVSSGSGFSVHFFSPDITRTTQHIESCYKSDYSRIP